jgi:hypothetical protein
MLIYSVIFGDKEVLNVQKEFVEHEKKLAILTAKSDKSSKLFDNIGYEKSIYY